MLNKYINIIYNKLNKFLKDKFEKENLIKIVNNIDIFNNFNNKINSDSNSLENYLLINLIDIKSEDINMNQHYYEPNGDGYIKKKKPLNLNLFCYIHSTFCDNRFIEGLEYLSTIISYFHTNTNFTYDNTIEIGDFNLSEFNVSLINDTTNYFSKLKIPYMPTILLKIGLIPIYAENISEVTYTGVKNF